MTLRRRRPGLVYPVNEDWHYVGEAGEPAFLNSWVNESTGYRLAFRLRETGIGDIQGRIKGGTSGDPIFQLPAAYRPAFYTSVFGAEVDSGTLTNALVIVGFTGTGNAYVTPQWEDSAVSVSMEINGQFFLTPPDAP